MRLKYLDSLRGIAILMVISAHAGQSVTFLPSTLQNITSFGTMGVPLFFVVPAFSLCHKTQMRHTNQSWLVFFVKRYFRIAPLYYIGIIGYLLFSMLENYVSDHFYFIARERYNTYNILLNMIFAHGINPNVNSNIVPGGWSIATEMAFYSFFPLLFVSFRSSTWYTKTLITSVLILISFFTTHTLLHQPQIRIEFIYGNILNMLPIFALSMIYYFKTGVASPIFSKRTSAFLASALLILAYLNYTYAYHITVTPIISGIAFVFLMNLFRHFNRLNINFLMEMGKRSYSLYIIHFVFAWHGSKLINNYLFEKWTPGLILILCFSLTLLVSYAFSILSESLIEKPGIALGKKIITKLSINSRIH